MKIHYELCVLIAVQTFSSHICTAKDITGSLGSTVTLPCQYTDGSGFVIWSYIYINGTRQDYSANRNILTVALPSDLHTRLNITGNEAAGEYNLQIKDMKKTDEGNYRCSRGINRYKQVNLYIQEAPSSVVVPGLTNGNRIPGTEDKDLTVTCRAVGGTPIPQVTLKGKNDNNVYTIGYQEVVHTFTAISRQLDMKRLVCQANTTALVNPLTMELQIYLELKPLKPELSHNPLATENLEPLLVSCISRGSRPAASFQWTIGNTVITSYSTEQVTNDTTTNTYTVTSTLTYTVNRNHNGQTLKCSAVNKVLPSGISTSETVNVRFAPEVTVSNITYTQNDDIRTVTCTAVGIPTAYTYKWRHMSRYGEVIREWNNLQSGILTLPNVPVEDRYQDGGEYKCTVSNGVTDIQGLVIESSGSGYITLNALPVVTSLNNHTQYVAVGTSTDLHVNVYSIPKYSTRTWLKDTLVISPSDKYALSERSAVVRSVFHNMEVQLDGYTLTLTINSLVKNDFGKYTLQLANAIGQTVNYNINIEPIGAPKTPTNFALAGSSESTVTAEWEPVYKGGYVQTFHIEYRKQGSSFWNSVEIPQDQNDKAKKLTHTLDGLQPGKVFEVRIYSENQLNRSSFTNTETIQTVKIVTQTSCGPVIGGVAGGLLAVIFIISVSFIIAFKRIPRKSPTKQRSIEKEYDNIGMEESFNDGQAQELQSKTQNDRFAKYEDIGVADKPSVYDELKDEDRGQNVSLVKTYETLGVADKPNVYEELTDKGTSKVLSSQKYETLGPVDKPNIYEELGK